MSTGGQQTVECSSCAADVPVDDAALLTAENSKGVWRYLCPDCLADLHVPKGYTLDRDLSFLRGGAGPDASADEADEPTAEAGGSGPGPMVVADFRGRVVTGEHPRDRLSGGRVLMDRRRLVLATDERKTAIPLAAVKDVVTTTESTDDDGDVVVAVTYGSERGDDIAFVSAERDTLRKFTAVLFKALLGGTAVQLVHPVDGGHRRGASPQSGVLDVQKGTLGVSGAGGPLSIELDQVEEVERRDRAWADGGQSVLAVSHRRDGRAVVSEIAAPSVRKLHLLWRYVRPQHRDRA